MSKTVATCIAETNQAQNMPQENVFFLTLSRKLEDFPNEFLRTARSTSPIQICAIFSTIGPDNLAAVLNLELNSELEKIVAAASNQPVLDFEGFSNQVINTLNVRVCNFAANKGQQFKTSMTMLVIEGDILRVIHVGVTKAVLFRDQRIMLLTEEQTVAHRYVQLGSITAEQEKNHPENMNLTQYLGKMPQDGQVQADRKIHLKLKDGDELFLMGLGISRQMPPQMRNQIIAKPVSTENKAKEMIASAVSYGIKSGLTFVDLKVESTFLLPGDAVIGSNLNSDGRVANQKAKSPEDQYTSFGGGAGASGEEEAENTISFVPGRGNEEEDGVPVVNEKKEKIMSVVIPLVIFLGCVVLGFGIMFLVFNMKNLITLDQEETTQTITIGSVLYVINDNTPVYSQGDTNSTIIGYLNRGDVVTLSEETNETFKKVVFSDGKEGYIMSAALTTEDPTLYDETSSEMLEDPTPVPEEETTTTAAETEATTTTADAAQNTSATTTTSETTTEATTQETEPPEEDQTEATTTTAATSETTTEATTESTTAATEAPTEPAAGGEADENAGN